MPVVEFGMTESARLCMRLESILMAMRYHLRQRGTSSRQLALQALMELLEVLQRPDVRVRLLSVLQEMDRDTRRLASRYSGHPERLQRWLLSLEEDMAYLKNEKLRFGHLLQEDALLTALRAQVLSQGLASYRAHPLCQLWLESDEGLFQGIFQRWFEPFVRLESVVMRILQCMRSQYVSTRHETVQGLARWDLPSGHEQFILGIIFPSGVIPSVSFGKQSISLTFQRVHWGASAATEPCALEIRFESLMSMFPIFF